MLASIAPAPGSRGRWTGKNPHSQTRNSPIGQQEATPRTAMGRASLGTMMALKTTPSRLKPASQTRASFRKTDGGKNAAHYQTPEHAAWRAAVKRRDGYRCVKCGTTGPRLIADHIVEIEDGGAALDVSNGQTLCQAHHNRKTEQARRARRGLMPMVTTGVDGWPI